MIIISCTESGKLNEFQSVHFPEGAYVEVRNVSALIVKCPDFANNARIPDEYTCMGADSSPEILVEGIPKDTKSLVLVVDDPDAPRGTWDHWIVFNIKPTSRIPKESVPGVQGRNSWGRTDYGGPCPPSGTHRYFFKVYALDMVLPLTEGASKSDVMQAMKGHILASGQLIGLYSKT